MRRCSLDKGKSKFRFNFGRFLPPCVVQKKKHSSEHAQYLCVCVWCKNGWISATSTNTAYFHRVICSNKRNSRSLYSWQNVKGICYFHNDCMEHICKTFLHLRPWTCFHCQWWTHYFPCKWQQLLFHVSFFPVLSRKEWCHMPLYLCM